MTPKLRTTIALAVISIVALASCARHDSGPTEAEIHAADLQAQKEKVAAQQAAAEKAAEEKRAAERAEADRLEQAKRDAEAKAARESYNDWENRTAIVRRLNEVIKAARKHEGYIGQPHDYTYEEIVKWALEYSVISADSGNDLAKRRNTAYVYDEPTAQFCTIEDYQGLLNDRAASKKELERQAAVNDETARILATPPAPLPTLSKDTSNP